MSEQEVNCKGETYTVQAGYTLNQIAQKYRVTLEELLAVNPQIENPNLIFVGQIICIPSVAVVPKKNIILMTYTEYLASISQFIARTVEGLVLVQELENGKAVVTFFGARLPAPQELKGDAFDSYLGEINIADERYFANLEIVIEEFSYFIQSGTITIEKPILVGTIVIPDNPFAVFKSKIAIKLYNQVERVMSDSLLVGRVIKDELKHSCEGISYVIQPEDTLYQIAQKLNISVEMLLTANPQLEDPSQLYIGQPLCIPEGVVPLSKWAVVLAPPAGRELSSLAGGVALLDKLEENNYAATFVVTGVPAPEELETAEFNDYLAVVEIAGEEYTSILKKTTSSNQEPTWAGVVVISNNQSVEPQNSRLNVFPVNKITKSRGDVILSGTADRQKIIRNL
ncbi:LysM peptidoglycan-binding domain-containing protein [Halanaerobacter jeridensis]|uniref:LysM repeat protein n=1 Tax=Halanaerobacter jeridensis TaxID=706427 RepID=A0A938XRZ0_9FIRM|nr:LysM peptidoglycan-binding domain-containing protein [Halanaerobacter jeridensis]MBM7556353.1 LysM repeat protein [Halanaerobacter jeridensis]